MKFVDYCESNKQMRRVCVSRIGMKPCKLQGRTTGSQGNLDKRRLKCRWRIWAAMGWAESIKWGEKPPAIVRGRVRGDVEKEMRRTTAKWRTSTNEDTTTNSTKTSLEFLPSKVTSLGVFDFFKKMITEVLVVLPLYLILFFICWRFRHLIKIMADVEDILNDEFLMMLLIHKRSYWAA